jgi:hypothetical protein
VKTYIYVDGFNLYYGALKRTPYKWLDIDRLCRTILPRHEIAKIRYFTARVSGRHDDPGKPTRQQMFLRALKTLPNLDVIYGHFLSRECYMPLAGCPPGAQEYAKVIRTEEKDSDVNLVGILNPHTHASRVLAMDASFVRRIRKGALRASQFPPQLTDAHGIIRKPATW